MNPEDLASQSVCLKEEKLRREEEKLREIEVKVQREMNEKRQELLARESQLREIEARNATRAESWRWSQRRSLLRRVLEVDTDKSDNKREREACFANNDNGQDMGAGGLMFRIGFLDPAGSC
jgi:hypothetical protein